MAINAHISRRAAKSLLTVTLLLSAAFAESTPAFAGAAPQHDGGTPTLMAVPSADASLMPIPDGAPSPTESASGDGMTSDGGMAGMDSHSDATMPSVSTPDAPQRHLVIGGFAVANALVLGAAAVSRRRRGKPTANAKAKTPAHTPRNSTTKDGGAA